MASGYRIDKFGPEGGNATDNDLLQLQTRTSGMNLSQLESATIKINDFEGGRLGSGRL